MIIMTVNLKTKKFYRKTYVISKFLFLIQISFFLLDHYSIT